MPIILHEYKTTFLLWLVPLLVLLGCLSVGLSVGLPLLLRLPSDPSTWVSVAIPLACGLGLPVLALLLWLLIPEITTSHDPTGGVVSVQYRRPMGRSTKTYALADVADIRPTAAGEHSYSLALILKTGQPVRLEYSSTSNTGRLEQQAARIKAQLGLVRGETVI